MWRRVPDNKLEALRRNPALTKFSTEDIRLLASRGDVVELPGDTPLMEQGRRGYEAFLVLDGEVGVLHDEQEVARLGPGEFVGEMAVLDGQPRSASVVSLGEVRLLVFDPVSFLKLENTSSELSREVVQQLSARLRTQASSS